MEILEIYREYLEEKDVAIKTVKDYVADIKIFINWVEEINKTKFNPQLITTIMTTTYKKYMIEERGYAPNTINRKITSIKDFSRFLVEKDYIRKNPGELLTTIQIQELAPESLSKVELIRLFNMIHAVDNPRDLAIFSILYNTGIRNGELSRLKLKYIEIGERSGSIYIKASKRYKSRTVSLNKDVRKDIQNYLCERPKTPGISLQEEQEEFLLKSERGFLTTSGIYRRVKKYGKMIGIDLKPHSLRHTFIRNLIDQGKDHVTIASMTGHGTVELLKIYGKPRIEHLEDAVESIEISNMILK